MAGDTVQTAIYKMGVEGQQTVDAAAASVDRLSVSEEKLTRATRTSADSVDRLLGRLDPRIRAEQQLQRTLEQLNRFEQEGIGTVQQRAQAISAATARYNEAVQRIGGTKAQDTFLGAGNAAKLSAFQIQTLSFQLQDVGQAIATGQPLFRTFIQQGSQIAQIFGPGVGVGGAMKAVGQGILQYVTNPLNIAVLGFSLAAGAAGLLFSTISGSKGESAADMLKRHKDLIDQITKAYGENTTAATAAQTAVGDMLRSTALQAQIENTKKLAQARKDLNAQNTFGSASVLVAARDLFANWNVPQGFLDNARKFREEFAKGGGDVEAYRRELDKLGQEFPTSESLAFIKSEKEATQAAYDLTMQQRELASALVGTDASIRGLAQGYTAMAEVGEAQRRQAAALQSINARSPAEKAAAASAGILAEAPDPSKDPTGAILLYKAQAAAELALATATHALTEAQRERNRALGETIISATQDIDLVGKGVAATEALRMQYQLIAALRAEASKNGTAVDQREVAMIKEKTAEYGRLKEKLAEISALRDLAFERSQFGRTESEKQVASALRGIYGDDYERQINGAVAGQIRLNAQIKESVDLAKDFVSGFASDLISGKDAVEALSDAFGRLGSRLLDIALNQAIEGLFGNLFGAGGGVLFGGASLGQGGIGHAHTGGVVGVTAFPSRYVHPAYFDEAPRMHGGGMIGQDEVPIVAKKGEEIGWPQQLAAKYGGGDTSVSIALSVDARGAQQGAGPEIASVLGAFVKSEQFKGEVVKTIRDANSRRMPGV